MNFLRIKGMLLNYYYITKNSLDRQWDILFWPLVELFIWGFMTLFINNISDLNIINTVLISIAIWIFFWRGSNDFVVFLLENYWSKNTYHLFVTPLTNAEFAVSLAIVGVVRSFISVVILGILSSIIYSVNIFKMNPVHTLLFISILVVFSWVIGMMTASCIIYFGTRVQILAWATMWIVQPFSCIFYPLNALPSWAAVIAKILPTTYVFEGIRASLASQPLHYAGLWYALGLSVVLLFLSGMLFSYTIRAAKKKGILARPEGLSLFSGKLFIYISFLP